MEAIYTLNDLTGIETSLLIYLGSKLNFKDFHHSKVTASVTQISKAIKFKSSAIKSAIKSLTDKSYLIVENNFDANGFKIENTYSISDYLFQCYVESKVCQVVDSRLPTKCQVVDSRLPTSKIPYSMPSSENQKNDNSENARVGRSPSLCQKDARVLDKNLDDSFVPEIPNQIPFENGLPISGEPKASKPMVTLSHNKMVLMFTPRPELKSFVHRNTILAFTDDLIIKYGELAHNAINKLYDNLVAEELCGAARWSIKRTTDVFNLALKEVTKK